MRKQRGKQQKKIGTACMFAWVSDAFTTLAESGIWDKRNETSGIK